MMDQKPRRLSLAIEVERRTMSEVTTYPDGKQIAREIIKHIASGKTIKYPFTLFLGNSQIQYMVCNNGQVYHCRTLVKTVACFKFSLFYLVSTAVSTNSSWVIENCYL